MRILVVEDEPTLGEILKLRLEEDAFAVDIETDGERGLYRARTNDYDVIILDDLLPGRRGHEICHELRKEGNTVPIMLISVQATVDKKVRVLNDGADDYLSKPFSFDEMRARLKALLRRPRGLVNDELRIGDLVLDEVVGAAFRNGERIHLTTKEFVLLRYLMANMGRLVTRAMLLDHVWDGEADPFSNTVEAHIYNLRRKVDGPGMKRIIHTVSGRGYILETLQTAEEDIPQTISESGE